MDTASRVGDLHSVRADRPSSADRLASFHSARANLTLSLMEKSSTAKGL